MKKTLLFLAYTLGIIMCWLTSLALINAIVTAMFDLPEWAGQTVLLCVLTSIFYLIGWIMLMDDLFTDRPDRVPETHG